MDHSGSFPVDPLDRAIARARGVIPDQGPIGVFIHHNTLHAYQHMSFHEGVQKGADDLGAKPYLYLSQFRAALAAGRILDSDLRLEIDRTFGDSAKEILWHGLTRANVWHALMTTDAFTDDAPGLAYSIASGEAEECKDMALWKACLARATSGPRLVLADLRNVRRHRDVIVALGGPDIDVPLNSEMIRLSAGFLDQGQADVVIPERERGFLQAVARLYGHGASAPRECRGAEVDMKLVVRSNAAADQVIRTSLEALGVTGAAVEPWLYATTLALAGWAGMFSRLERFPNENPGGPPVALYDFLAVRLLFERRAIECVCKNLGVPSTWEHLRSKIPPLPPRPALLDAALLWRLARDAKASPSDVTAIDPKTLELLWYECAAATDVARRKIFLEAYERSYREIILDAVAARRDLPNGSKPELPRAQFVFCMDEREESTRRAVEEQHPGYVTFGMAGFFGVAIDYQALYDRDVAPHCPVVVTPAHEVHELPVVSSLARDRSSKALRNLGLSFESWTRRSSRTLSGGFGTSLLIGPLAGLKTAARILAPRLSLQMGGQMANSLAPMPTTRLSALRVSENAIIREGGKPRGFSLKESTDRVFASLNNIGLVRNFAPIIVVLGHGSTSLNNPHESAHDCGACGGRRGGANARLFADLANRPDVRDGLRQRGVDIPADTWFVGGVHDTADDSVKYSDLDQVPVFATAAFEEAYAVMEKACRDDARERCRRYENVALDDTPENALRHVEGRSAHLAQPRPEYGHCTNSVAIIGRRGFTRGLHLDRRAFLISYDPTIDPNDAIIERILAAVGPVGAGISLEYYFSSVDNEVFGCGTKLPHNVTGLIGIMNGHSSDLRTGLPLQMVELHEPMRLLILVDATPEALLGVAGRQAEVAELVVKEWVQLVSVHPETGDMQVFDRGQFVPYKPRPTLLPVVEKSPQWHLQSRAHLTPALVRCALPPEAVGPGHTGAPPPLASVTS